MVENIAIRRMKKDDRFLLIKSWGAGFWSDMEDVQSKLLLAEITNRRPVVFWGETSAYSVGENYNAFEQYFLPVSDYLIGDVVSDKYTYFPPVWKFSNIFQEDWHKRARMYRDVPSFIRCEANVMVSDVHNYVYEFMPWLKEDHPAYGLSEDDIYRYITNKYIKLRSEIADEIDEFYNANMKTGPILAVHIRSGGKILEVGHLNDLNQQYCHEIDHYLKENPSACIFMLTDDEHILTQYREMYGDILIYTDCNRKRVNGLDPDVQIYSDRIRKGIEIVKDTWLACRCDYFIGNGHSNVSIAISRLKAWGKDRIKLFI